MESRKLKICVSTHIGIHDVGDIAILCTVISNFWSLFRNSHMMKYAGTVDVLIELRHLIHVYCCFYIPKVHYIAMMASKKKPMCVLWDKENAAELSELSDPVVMILIPYPFLLSINNNIFFSCIIPCHVWVLCQVPSCFTAPSWYIVPLKLLKTLKCLENFLGSPVCAVSGAI